MSRKTSNEQSKRIIIIVTVLMSKMHSLVAITFLTVNFCTVAVSACSKFNAQGLLESMRANEINQTQSQIQRQQQQQLVNNNSSTDHLVSNIQSTAEQQKATNELDKLRIEYYKFKILSQLGITINPDTLSTAASQMDEDLRYNLTASIARSESQSRTSSMRHKRSLKCSEIKSNKDSCCVDNFFVNFTEIGWDKWILYPSGYNANYCRGQCDLSHARYYHSTLLSKYSHLIGLCCSPRQMAPLRLLYIDEHNKVHQKSMADMVVESCDCA